MTPTEETVQETAVDTAEHTHSHEHGEHSHDHAGHEHHHHHAPTLNPELTRSISVEAPAGEVTKAFQQATKRYSKLARIPGFRAGKVPPTLIKSRLNALIAA